MVHMSRAVGLVKRFGVVVLAPGYRLSLQAPYPAATEDCYAALLYLKEHAAALGVRSDQIMVGGESAGGGLCAAVCIRARDTGEVNVAFQMPLYPMLDDRDTETSRENHGRVWNTRRNHLAWRLYLRRTPLKFPVSRCWEAMPCGLNDKNQRPVERCSPSTGRFLSCTHPKPPLAAPRGREVAFAEQMTEGFVLSFRVLQNMTRLNPFRPFGPASLVPKGSLGLNVPPAMPLPFWRR